MQGIVNGLPKMDRLCIDRFFRNFFNFQMHINRC